MNVLDLFSGIGGFSLGLERAGMRTVAFCEIDPFCRRVLAKHWPSVPVYDDVRSLTADRLRADGIAPDVICGGFPCQDISVAGKGAGIEGERSGLWSEYARIIGEVQPRYVIVENVAALLGRGLDRVLGDLATLGFDAEWHCIPASAVGAPHRRDRIWIAANSRGLGICELTGSGYLRDRQRSHPQTEQERDEQSLGVATVRVNGAMANTEGQRCGEARQYSERHQEWSARGSEILADADSPRLSFWLKSALGETAGDAESERQDSPGGEWWAVEPDVGRVAHGVPARVDRLRSLGNAVVPQIPEIIGRAIMRAEA